MKYKHIKIEVEYYNIPTACDEYSERNFEIVSFCKHPQKDKWVLLFRTPDLKIYNKNV